MDMLSQALKTRLPFVHITTDDIIHVREVLSYIAEEEVVPLTSEHFAQDPLCFPEGNVFYTNCDVPTPKLYLTCKNAHKCIVFVNTKASVLHFNGGVMFPPKDLMEAFLLALLGEEDKVTEVLPAYGGLTLKDMYEVTMLTIKREGTVTTRGINTTRQGYITKLKGITQIDTNVAFYQCPPQLQTWMDKNLPFFTNPISKSLTPRGLLLDGPPGTGKTMGGKHIANSLGMPLYHLDIGGVKDKYVGNSEGNLQAALAQIDQVEPCVVIIDEVEKIFGESHDSGVTTSLLSALLWWLQEHDSRVFTVMTTNAKSKIPPELYREGRIDETMMFMGLDSLGQAVTFAQSVFDAVTKSIDVTLPPLDVKAMTEKINVLFSAGTSVPQVKITQVVNNTIKEMMLEVMA